MPTNGEKSGGEMKRARRVAKKAGARGVTASAKEERDAAPAEAAVRSTPPSTRGLLAIGGVRERDIISFLRQLIMLLEAGTPILKSLRTLSQRGQRASVRALVADIAQYVEHGNPLWQAFDRHPKYFRSVFVNMVKASEASGTLVTVLKRMADYRERRQMLVKRVRGAMWYPVVLVGACLVVVLVMAKIVIPSFQDLFTRLDIPLPAFTRGFIATMEVLGKWSTWAIIVIALLALIMLYKLWFVQNPLRRRTADRIKLRIPILGGIVRKLAIVEFTRTLALLLRSGLPIMSTLELVRNAIKNQAVADVINDIRDSVERGSGIEGPLRDADHIIPPVVTDLLVTGEESGRLDEISDQVADIYEEEARIAINALGEMLTPILTIMIGILVLILAYSFFRPLVSMISGLATQTQGSGGGQL